jgi:hypothetical protein
MSIIDKLIQETLFEFTSLQDKSEEMQGGSSGSGFELASFQGFGPGSDDEIPAGRPSELLIQSSLPAAVFEEGNLAALEGPEEEIPDSVRSYPGEDWEAEILSPPRDTRSSTVPARESGPQGDCAAKGATLVSAGQAGHNGGIDAVLAARGRANKGQTMKSAVVAENLPHALKAAREEPRTSSVSPMSQRPLSEDSGGKQNAAKIGLIVFIVAGVGAALFFSGAL